VYRDAIFSAIVSSTNGASQNFIPKALRATRYSLRKALIIKVHVDETNENIWVGLPRKWHCDVIDEKDSELIMRWWDTATTISPNKHDIKRRQISMKTFEEHLIHYLQESQLLFKT
jgi:DNA polymerase sigma